MNTPTIISNICRKSHLGRHVGGRCLGLCSHIRPAASIFSILAWGFLAFVLALACSLRGRARSLQYTPDSLGYFVCHDGDNSYTRALYGSHTLWRLETSDRPIFGAYHKSDNRNINFIIVAGNDTLRADSTELCTSLYRGGERVYRLSHPSWGKGEIEITVVASATDETAYWRVDARDMPKGSRLIARCCTTVPVKLNRNADLGADPPHAFDPNPNSAPLHEVSVDIAGRHKTRYIEYTDRSITADSQSRIKKLFDTALADTRRLAGRITIDTPDPYINTLGATLSTAADGIYDGETFLHGAIGWRMPLAGWRGAYAGDFLGWHDRAASHFNAYAASQVTDVAQSIPHPAQDSTLHLARAEKRWGTPMYSNGYLCRNPGRNNVMHHYDMNLCYIDELLWHLQWTGDTCAARRFLPVIERSLEWEKRNYDPDDDALYDAYCCIWASDALYYNSGAVTHSSAYNHRANLLTAKIERMLGNDGEAYAIEARRIRAAVDSVLWMPDKGVWAEFRDAMGRKALHTHPAVWTVYHAIDGDIASPAQAYNATRYIDANIPHIAVTDTLATISTTDWMPYAWSINNVAFAEVYNTALAYWQAGRPDEATALLKAAVVDGMFMGASPANIGQISHYDAARGECYRDFADPVGVLSRAVVQGLFGFTPHLLDREITIRPGFPSQWQRASITHPDFSLKFHGVPAQPQYPLYHTYIETYELSVEPSMLAHTDSIEVVLPHRYAKHTIIYDGAVIDSGTVLDRGTPYATLRFKVPVSKVALKDASRRGTNQASANCTISILVLWSGNSGLVADTPAQRFSDTPRPLGTKAATGDVYESVDMQNVFNADISDIFRNRYLSPRSSYTTLQIPDTGIGEWCHPNDNAEIADTYLRGCGGILRTASGIPFATPATGHNIAYTSLFDNYPDSISVPLSGRAKAVDLLMTGSSNHMQCYNPVAEVVVRYTDGTADTLTLVPPYNWAPIEQDYYTDGKAFDIPVERPVRIAMATGDESVYPRRHLGTDGINRRIAGGAATVLSLPLHPERELASLTVRTLANEVVVGLVSATLVR